MPIVTTSTIKRKSRSKAPLILTAVILIAGTACYLVFNWQREPAPTKPADAVKPAMPAAPMNPTTETDMSAVDVADAQPPANPEKADLSAAEPVKLTKEQELFNKTNNYVKKPGQMLLPDGQILTFPPPKPGEVRLVASNSRIYECDSEGNWRDTTKRNLFDTAFEANFLNLAVEGKAFIPAFLTGLDQDEVVKVLKKDYVAKGDETEEEMAEINAFLEMKGAALDYIEQGGTFDDFVNEFASYVKAERQMHAKSRKQVMMLYKEGRIEEAKAKAEALNAVLVEQGYKPLRLPAHVRKAFGEE